MTGDWFVYGLITLNAGAMLTYGWQGNWWKAAYWFFVIGLNYCILKMR